MRLDISGLYSRAERITKAPPHEWEVDVHVPAFMDVPRKVGRIYEHRDGGRVGYSAVVEAATKEDEVPAPRGREVRGLGWASREEAQNAVAAQAVRILVADAFGQL